MRRLLRLGLAILVSAPVSVYALSLGNLELRSALHQPLDARVPILSATGDEIDSLRVKIASPEEFARAGVEYRAVLTQAKFEIQRTSKGPDYIRITSHDPVREPFLNFLLEVNWSKGRLIREFTILLDPPLYDPSRRISWEPARVQPVAPAAAPAPTSGRELQIAKTPSAAPMPAPAAMPAPSPASPTAAPIAPAPPAGDGTYNTLWSAATAMRPDNSVSIQQMMLALLRTNPDAFIRGNINLLKKGYVLKMPERGAIDSVSRAEALAEVQRHHALWREYRERGAASVPRQPEGAATVAAAPGDTSGGTAAESQDEANLRLLAGNETGAAAGKGADGDLALAKESLESKARENEELRAQLKESEEIIEKLKSRVSLQDEQLAELQSKLGEGSAEPAATTPTAEASAVMESPETIAEPSPPLELNPESWRSLDNVVQTPTYPLPEPTPAAAEEMPAAEEPATEAPAEATPEAEAPPTAAVAETPPEEPAPMVEEAPPATAEVEAPAEAAPEEASPEEAPPEATAEAPPEEPAPEEPTPPGGGFFDKLNNLFGTVVPKSLLEAVPGGAATLLGALVALIGGLVALLARRRAAPAPESFPTTAEEGENAFDLALGGARAAGEQILDDSAFVPATTDEDELFAATSHTEPVVKQPGAEPEFEREAAADEDPLAEVNVYLAYERFDEAERLIKEAIAANPGESKYRLRLLEVYYSSNDRTKYEAAARELRDAVGGQGPLWDSAVAMWREMSPNRELFAGGEEPVVPAVAAREQRQFVDITAVEDMASRTVTTLAPAVATAGEAAAASTSAELGEAGETPSVFDVASADQDFDLLDITASGDVREADSDILDISAGVGTGTGEMAFSEPASIEGASSAVNELLSLTKSNAVTPSQPSEADYLESSLDFDPGLARTSGSPENPEATVGPDHLLDFDLGTDTGSVAKAPENNIVDFPARAESLEPTPDSLTTMIDVAPAATPAEAPIEFDIGGLDLALDAESTAGTKGGEASLDLALESPGAAEVTMGDIDSLSLDEDTVRLFENDLASTSAQDTMPMFEPDSDMTATGDRSKGGGFGKSATGEDELTLDNDDLTLDDITKSLEETVGSKARTYSEFETVDLTLDAKALMDNEQTAELFEQELKHDGADDGFGPAAATLGTQGGDDVDTKLNLAKAYIELGDAAGARTILDEVTGEGSETQREEAQRLLRELTT